MVPLRRRKFVDHDVGQRVRSARGPACFVIRRSEAESSTEVSVLCLTGTAHPSGLCLFPCTQPLVEGMQAELNAKVALKEFDIAGRYPAILMVLFVCLTYSAGMPLLIPIGLASFVVFYWVEKLLLYVSAC